MDRLGNVTAKRALLLLCALIILGGFVLALLSNAPFGSFSSSGTNQVLQQDTIVSPRGIASGGLAFAVGNANYQPQGSTQVISSATSSINTGEPPLGKLTGGAAVGTGSLLEFFSNVTIQSAEAQTTASKVASLAYSVGGYVAYQATYKDSAIVIIRVPASQYQQTLSSVEALGTVVSLVSNSNDVTVQVTDLNATLASLKTEQGALLRLLNKSTAINSTLAIESQLQGVNQQINDIESQILQTKTLIDYSTIDVAISESAPLTVVLEAAPKNGTVPFSVTFNAIVKGGSPPYIVNYNFGDGSADQGQILIHTYYQTGNFKVTVTVTDQNGTAVTAWTRVLVEAAPVQIGISNFFGTIANLFVSVVEDIVEVAVVVLPLAAIGAVVVIPLRRRNRPQKEPKLNQ